MIKQIVWDWNGTLLDDAWLCVQSMNKVLKRRKMPELTSKRYQEVFDFPVVKYYKLLGFNFELEPFTKVGTEFIDEYYLNSHKLQLQQDAKNVLQSLKDYKISQSILSAQKQSSLEKLVFDFGLNNYFDKVVGLDNHYAYSKVENGINLINNLQQNPDEVILIGDTIHDYDVAQEMEVSCVLIPSGHHSEAKLKSTGATVISSLKEVVSLVN